MNRLIAFLITIVLTKACTEAPKNIDLQGHRGYRGLYPENTIPAFMAALDVGVTTLEMDVVISKDKQVVVSHEPYFSHEIALTPSGEEITAENEKQYNLYALTYEEIKLFDVGKRAHDRFPDQKKMAAYKPLLSEVIAEAERYAAANGLPKPYYNIEIKRNPKYDSVFHPTVNEFVQLVLDQIAVFDMDDRICIQSFDIETLKRVNEVKPELTLALLIENNASFEQNIERLGFNPEIYSPYFELVNESLIQKCAAKNIKVIPWTVNQEEDVLKMIELNVDGIITDFPAKVREILQKKDVSILNLKTPENSH